MKSEDKFRKISVILVILTSILAIFIIMFPIDAGIIFTKISHFLGKYLILVIIGLMIVVAYKKCLIFICKHYYSYSPSSIKKRWYYILTWPMSAHARYWSRKKFMAAPKLAESLRPEIQGKINRMNMLLIFLGTILFYVLLYTAIYKITCW